MRRMASASSRALPRLGHGHVGNSAGFLDHEGHRYRTLRPGLQGGGGVLLVVGQVLGKGLNVPPAGKAGCCTAS